MITTRECCNDRGMNVCGTSSKWTVEWHDTQTDRQNSPAVHRQL